MIEWEKCIKWGDFMSTSGIPLKFKWEFDRLNRSNKEMVDRNIILTSILSLAHPYDIVAIHTVNPRKLKQRCKAIYYPIDNISNGIVDDKYVLYDDVVTTGKSMIKAIEKYAKIPEKCICIVDRRNESKKNIYYKGIELEIISIMDKLQEVI